MEHQWTWETLGEGLEICVSPDHKFGTDAFLLSDFAARAGEERTSLYGKVACDLGTGCGIIPLLWFRTAKSPKKVWAVDIQPQAIGQLTKTLERGASQETGPDLSVVTAVLSDLKDLGKGDSPIPAGVCDLITCNPPYKLSNTGIMSTPSADKVARHEILCNINDVCRAAARLLKFGGRLCICQRPERLADVLEAMRKYKLEPKRLRFVQKLGDTAPWLFLVEGKLGSKPFLQVEAPLIIENGEGGFSEELLRIYNKKHNLVKEK